MLRNKSLPELRLASYQNQELFEFRDRVLSWKIEQILAAELAAGCEQLAPIYSNSSKYYNSFKPLIVAEAKAVLKEGLEEYKKNKISCTSLKVRAVKSRRFGGPTDLEMNGPRRTNLDPKLEIVLLKNIVTNQLFLGSLSVKKTNSQNLNIMIKCSGVIDIRVNHVFQVYQLCSLVTLNRAYDACIKKPTLNFEANLIAANNVHRNKDLTPAYFNVDFMNSSQKDAISEFLNLEAGLKLLQGPPGTGKTSTIVSLLHNMVANGETVLVCAPSNKAVQVIAKKFLEKNSDIPMIFAGREEKLDVGLESIFLDAWKANIAHYLKDLELAVIAKIMSLEAENEGASLNLAKIHTNLQELHSVFDKILAKVILYGIYDHDGLVDVLKSSVEFKQIQSLNLELALENLKMLKKSVIDFMQHFSNISDIDAYLLGNSKVVFCTLSFAGQQRMAYMNIKSLIIDEAAQATEAETIIPLQHLPNKCLLVGDTNQLPALVKSEIAKNNNYNWSMMHRLQVEAGYSHKMLTIQYRMHPMIRSWPSKRFYDNKLEDAADITLRPSLSLPAEIYPYVFIDIHGNEQILHRSKKNDDEAILVIKLLNYLQGKGYNLNQQVGIITFYSGQVERINQGIRAAKLSGILPQTVDGFQGEEKEIIIISFVRANKDDNVGFLNDFRRLNVALTRAKKALIMVGDRQTLLTDETLKDMLAHCSYTKSMQSAHDVEHLFSIQSTRIAKSLCIAATATNEEQQKRYWQSFSNKALIPMFKAEWQLWSRYEQIRKKEETLNMTVPSLKA